MSCIEAFFHGLTGTHILHFQKELEEYYYETGLPRLHHMCKVSSVPIMHTCIINLHLPMHIFANADYTDY